jgi:hypothetical protein
MADLARALGPSAAAAATMYASVAATRLLLPTSLSAIVALAVLIAVGGLAYVLASALFNRRGSGEFVRLLRSAATTRADAPTPGAQ